MKSLDTFKKQIISEENALKFLSKKEYSEFISLTKTGREKLLQELLNRPI
jgi:hypothetical protein